MNNLSIKRKLVLVVSIVLVVGVVLLAVFASGNKKNNTYGDQVTIKNYDIRNLPTDRRDSIFTALYKVISFNQVGGSNKPNVDDAMIRSGSDQQQYDASNSLYTGHFIVDIKSIRQSYYIQYSYSTNDANAEVGGYPVTATCLPVDQLVYGDFSCKDALQIESAGIDPILQYLPQSTLSYQITASTDADNKTVLNIRLLLSEADYRIGEQEAVSTYKQEALDWISSKGLKPSDYVITISY